MKGLMTGLRLGVCALAAAVAMQAAAELPSNIRVVIGSKSTGGDTYQSTSIVAEALSEKLGSNFKVDATGAPAAFKAVERSRSSDGSTIMVFHDQAYLGVLYDQKGYDDPFANYSIGPTFAINPGNAYLVSKKSPYRSVEQIIDAAGNGETVRVAIQPGGVSEIGYTALKNAVKLKYPGKEDNLKVVNTGSQDSKNQAMFDGLADVINGSVQSNEQYTRLPADDQKAMSFVWLTAREQTIQQAHEEGMGKTPRADLLKFVAPQVQVPMGADQDFTFDKEFFFLYNKDIDPAFVAAIDKALEEIFAEGKIQEVQKKSFFIPNFKPAAEAQTYLKEKNDRIADVINAIKG
ncbi:ABC transporter substrate-binding protein [Marinobacterium rhizophilum]|uniref:ABC transporter substrate-binding protein n=1 Tax=Marinobacterium rhizophilum TaxID=420402 RepID=A0ABY5HGJ3_9GAMM|nr:ABC transporter substrate-binding protein [Marinobacterium rhizophilum]UTW11491.1 ABC transporter substrate-binding protein [Marinobacterium rhizophilum]